MAGMTDELDVDAAAEDEARYQLLRDVVPRPPRISDETWEAILRGAVAGARRHPMSPALVAKTEAMLDRVMRNGTRPEA